MWNSRKKGHTTAKDMVWSTCKLLVHSCMCIHEPFITLSKGWTWLEVLTTLSWTSVHLRAAWQLQGHPSKAAGWGQALANLHSQQVWRAAPPQPWAPPWGWHGHGLGWGWAGCPVLLAGVLGGRSGQRGHGDQPCCGVTASGARGPGPWPEPRWQLGQDTWVSAKLCLDRSDLAKG